MLQRFGERTEREREREEKEDHSRTGRHVSVMVTLHVLSNEAATKVVGTKEITGSTHSSVNSRKQLQNANIIPDVHLNIEIILDSIK